jgi:Spy/CpxP family protein refolding chaperone
MCRSHGEYRMRHACHCEPTHHHRYEHHHWPGDERGQSFGVRRPLRFLAWRLGLDEEQVAKLAEVLNELKTERAQHEVDDRRALTSLAEAVQATAFTAESAREAAKQRVESEQRLQAKVVESLERIHAILSEEQRGKLAYLLRTGALVM